ncbi:unnamed protein product [Didymodactylos carnosus]|uniref:Uncharacterized protein n=1 Tax=Didymodactylos carnosus TaxID=1234261 RepID=A0A815AWH0_9BILA|nr:unnamed protein product [Didymodactylos carnosus]CAF4041726.1 unnamed protein product [Didymodactylos carnosus]
MERDADPCRTVSAENVVNMDELLTVEQNKLSAAVSRNIKTDSIKEQDEGEVEEEINLETYSLLWCDENVNKTDENREIQTELRRAINYLKAFDSIDLCKHYIQRKSNEEIILIVSGRTGSQLIKFVTNSSVELIEQITNGQLKLNKIIRQDLKLAVFNPATLIRRTPLTTTTLVSSKEYSHQNLDSNFMWFQLMVEVFLRMNDETRKNGLNELIANCKKQFSGNHNDLAIIEGLEECYHPQAALYLYTSDSFLYKMLNRALRCQDVSTLVTLCFFIRDIHDQLKFEQKLFPSDTTVHVFRGQLMSLKELEKLKMNVGHYVSMSSFFQRQKIDKWL